MPIDKPKENWVGAQKEEKDPPDFTLDQFLKALQEEKITTLSADEIRGQLEETGVAIMTRMYDCGIRISRSGSKKRGYQHRTWTTNALEDPNHHLSKKFGKKNIEI